MGEVGKGRGGEGEGQTARRKAAKQIKNVSVCEGGKKVNVLVPISQKGKESLRSFDVFDEKRSISALYKSKPH